MSIAGGDKYDFVNGKYEKVIGSSNIASGAVQLFRKDCFSEINGYRELDNSGIDVVTESIARFKGLEIRTFRDIIFYR